MSSEETVPPVDASTVILVRHGEPVGAPWQCFMVRRHARSAFAAGVYVFPGGKVDPSDASPDLLALVDSEPHPMEPETGRDRWLALKVAAIRELFEEAGVLLATCSTGGLVEFRGGRDSQFADYRRRLQAGNMTLLDIVNVAQLRLTANRLHPFSRWITPVGLPRRFDTRFWVAYLPSHQEPQHDEHETTGSVWISPKEALKRYRAGEFPLVFATLKHLERMARYHSIEQMIAETSLADLQPITPRIVQENGETRFLLPGEEGYQSDL